MLFDLRKARSIEEVDTMAKKWTDFLYEQQRHTTLAMRAVHDGLDTFSPEDYHDLMSWTGFDVGAYHKIRGGV